MGKFLNEIRQESPQKRRDRISEILQGLNDQDGKDLQEALVDSTITPAQIIKALQARGITLHGSIITRYRATHVAR